MKVACPECGGEILEVHHPGEVVEVSPFTHDWTPPETATINLIGDCLPCERRYSLAIRLHRS